MNSARVLSFKFGAKEKLGCDAFSRIGACGRRPSLSADPGVRRAGALRGSSFAGVEEEASTGAGAEARWWYPDGNLGVQDGCFYGGKVRNLALGTCPGPDGSPVGSPGGLRRSPGELL